MKIEITFDVKNVDCLMSGLFGGFSISMRDIEPRPPLPLRCPFRARCWFSSTLVENLLANFRAFGDKRKRSDFERVGGFGSMIGCARASDVILWITRTPRRTIDRRVKRSSAWSAEFMWFSKEKPFRYIALPKVGKEHYHAKKLKLFFVHISYPNELEYHSLYQSELLCISWLAPIGRSVALNWPLPVKMDMQSFQVFQSMLASMRK